MKTKIEYLGVDAPTLSANPISKVKAIASSPESCVIAAATCMSCFSLLKVHVSTESPRGATTKRGTSKGSKARPRETETTKRGATKKISDSKIWSTIRLAYLSRKTRTRHDPTNVSEEKRLNSKSSAGLCDHKSPYVPSHELYFGSIISSKES